VTDLKKSFFRILSLVAFGMYRRFPVFGSLHASIGIIRNGDLYLVIDRSDRRGYCFPGGLALPWEDEPSALAREILEETGLRVVRSDLRTRYFSRVEIPCQITVFDVHAEGALKDGSWEGSTVWAAFPELQRRIVASQRPVLDSLAAARGTLTAPPDELSPVKRVSA
jgi:8-oxo-dGTP pyrophosphatase MutT (NUDIX family)